MRGSGWLAANGPSNRPDNERRHAIPIDGKARIAQRFAIDWVMKEQLANLSAVAFQNEYVKGIDALGGFPTCEFLLEGASDRIFRFVRLGIPAIPAPPRTVILLV